MERGRSQSHHHPLLPPVRRLDVPRDPLLAERPQPCLVRLSRPQHSLEVRKEERNRLVPRPVRRHGIPQGIPRLGTHPLVPVGQAVRYQERREHLKDVEIQSHARDRVRQRRHRPQHSPPRRYLGFVVLDLILLLGRRPRSLEELTFEVDVGALLLLGRQRGDLLLCGFGSGLLLGLAHAGTDGADVAAAEDGLLGRLLGQARGDLLGRLFLGGRRRDRLDGFGRGGGCDGSGRGAVSAVVRSGGVGLDEVPAQAHRVLGRRVGVHPHPTGEGVGRRGGDAFVGVIQQGEEGHGVHLGGRG
mmetsp:Transcript_5986/g.17328  ORF Transcript_5986/g.17328 Transcript_5986/m.17328 type:complete len:301 (-) Transcript_5986:4434-5336(-)